MRRIIFFFEDEQVDNFYPLSLSHTPAEFLCGILSLGDKWTARIEHDEFRLITRPYLQAFLSENLQRRVNDFDLGDYDEAVFINPRFIGDDAPAELLEERSDNVAITVEGRLALLRLALTDDSRNRLASLSADTSPAAVGKLLNALAGDAEKKEFSARSVNYLWDLVHENSKEIERDFQLLIPELNFSDIYQNAEIDEDCLIYNEDDVYIGRESRLDGQVVIDARSGPVYIGENVIVSPHTRIEGPAYIGDFCQLVGGKIRTGCSFGPHCRVGGEVEESIFLGYSNKYHEGFIGHAYVGEWVNFGALTTNSDLKNNYGEIKVELPQGLLKTGHNKIGSFVGDHTKTGIGTLLTTGMVLGFSANLFGGGLAGGRFLPSFMWGGKDGFVDYAVDKAIETARVVKTRRSREFTLADEALFRHLFAATAPGRGSWQAKE